MRRRLILARLREPSTWAALAALAQLAGAVLPPDLAGHGPALVSLCCALLGVAMPERPPQ